MALPQHAGQGGNKKTIALSTRGERGGEELAITQYLKAHRSRIGNKESKH